MNAADIAIEICIASAEEAMRFSGFVQAFLLRNGFPFVMIHDDPDLCGERRKVVFEDAVVSHKFACEWRAGALGVA